MKRVRVVVRGNVQGVFFRDSVRRLATEQGVAGWVQNRSDGSVEAVFEGSPEGVHELVEYCRQGPRGAAVERVDISDEESDGQQGFDVR